MKTTLAMWLVLTAGVAGCASRGAGGRIELAIRAENLTVTPSTGPVAHVLVLNRSAGVFDGTIQAVYPAGWKTNRSSQNIRIAPGQTARVPFALERATDSPDNRYPVRLIARSGGASFELSQVVQVASAPYFKPAIDGKHDDWADAIPLSFLTGQQKTTISTYWSARHFYVLVAVQEQTLARSGGDAVQLALAPRDAAAPTSPNDRLGRYELLITPTETSAKCHLLARPADPASRAAEARPLTGTEMPDAQAVLTRQGGTTYYEIAIPLDGMPEIRPEPGREFCFSVLVHDADGTGPRDLGQALGLWPSQRNRMAWCNWPGAKWPAEAPYDSRIEWGFCSSKK